MNATVHLVGGNNYDSEAFVDRCVAEHLDRYVHESAPIANALQLFTDRSLVHLPPSPSD